jgi:hypothetical protein
MHQCINAATSHITFTVGDWFVLAVEYQQPSGIVPILTEAYLRPIIPWACFSVTGVGSEDSFETWSLMAVLGVAFEHAQRSIHSKVILIPIACKPMSNQRMYLN